MLILVGDVTRVQTWNQQAESVYLIWLLVTRVFVTSDGYLFASVCPAGEGRAWVGAGVPGERREGSVWCVLGRGGGRTVSQGVAPSAWVR